MANVNLVVIICLILRMDVVIVSDVCRDLPVAARGFSLNTLLSLVVNLMPDKGLCCISIEMAAVSAKLNKNLTLALPTSSFISSFHWR